MPQEGPWELGWIGQVLGQNYTATGNAIMLIHFPKYPKPLEMQFVACSFFS